MKFFFVICAISTIPLIEGFPNDYEQMLEPRGIADSLLSWFYDEPENENDTDEDTSGGYTWNTASQMTESFQIEDRNKVIPVGKVTPKTKVEPIEDLLKELNEEIKQSSDEVEKKTVFDTLTEIKGNLKNAPSRFVNVMVNNTRRLVDIGSFGSSRRTRSLQEVNSLAGLIEWILSFFNIFGNLTGNLSSSGAQDSQGILKTYFGNPAHEQSTSIIGFPNMKKSSDLNLGDGFGNHDLNVFILNNKRANAEADNIFKGKTNDETMDNIEKVLRGKTNADAKTKWLILVELGNMYNDVLDDKTKKRIIHLILLICDDKEFDELFDIIKEMDDPACKRIFNLFITERENLKNKLKVIETSMSNDKDPVSKKMSNAEKKHPVSGDDNNSVEYYITEIDKNKGQKSEPRKVDEKEYRSMFSNASNMDSPTTHSDIKQPAPEIQRSTINPAHRNDDISPASPVGSLTPAQAEPVTKTKESHPPNKPSNDSHQQPYLQTYYPYYLASPLITMNYDPHEKTYIVENEHYGLDDVLGRINFLIEDKQDILREVEHHIAEDLTSWIAFLGNNENEQSKVNDQTYRNIIKTIDNVGSSPKFHDFHNELKSTKNLSPEDRGILECIFGDTPPVNQHENNHGHPPPTHFEEFTFIPHGDPNSNSFGYTQIKKSFSTQSHSDTFPSTPVQLSTSTNESLRRKLTHYIDLQNALRYREMELPTNVKTKMNLEEQIKDSKFNTLRNEFTNKVTPQHLVSQLRSFQDYLKSRGINATNEEDEKKVIQEYIKDHYKA